MDYKALILSKYFIILNNYFLSFFTVKSGFPEGQKLSSLQIHPITTHPFYLTDCSSSLHRALGGEWDLILNKKACLCMDLKYRE